MLSFAYFPMPDKDRECKMCTITQKDGLDVLKRDDHHYDVSFQGKTVHFTLPPTGETPPRVLPLLPDEEFVGQIQDESGIRFFLMFNKTTTSFYEVLNEEDGVTDTLDNMEGSCLIGNRTGFVFWQDPDVGRKILVGVHLADGLANDYYDGPGDQVPFRAHLRDKLHLVYPSTLTKDGIDEHGVWRNTPQWCRFVVAPFYSYQTPQELVERVRRVDPRLPKSELWTALAKEWWYTPEWIRGMQEQLKKEGKAFPVQDPLHTLRFDTKAPPPAP